MSMNENHFWLENKHPNGTMLSQDIFIFENISNSNEMWRAKKKGSIIVEQKIPSYIPIHTQLRGKKKEKWFNKDFQ